MKSHGLPPYLVRVGILSVKIPASCMHAEKKTPAKKPAHPT
jgi:hypothetical protein